MKETVNEPGNLLLTGYSGDIDEVELNWGFKKGYFQYGEIKIPVLFIYSNFPQNISTNRQSLVGTIRTHVEEKRGIIFFPNALKEEVLNIFREASKKEKVDLDFHPYSGEKYNPDYLAQICNTCFSIKNIKLKEVIKMAQANLSTPNSHQEMIKSLKGGNEELTCFIMEKKDKKISESLHLEIAPSSKSETTFDGLVKDKTFKTLFFDLFSGENSVPERIKGFYYGENWKFHSLLIFYSGRKKRVFIQDSKESAFFLNANEILFRQFNTQYSLVNYKYKTKPDQQIVIASNNFTEKFDISIDARPTTEPSLIGRIMNTFPGCTNSINQFLHMITHTQSNEYRFFYDEMCVFVRIVGNKYLIDSYES